jgi:hypothetical protein
MTRTQLDRIEAKLIRIEGSITELQKALAKGHQLETETAEGEVAVVVAEVLALGLETLKGTEAQASKTLEEYDVEWGRRAEDTSFDPPDNSDQ